jgi:hypothetical protein
MNAAALNDNAVTDAAERMHLPTLAGGDAEEEEDTAQSDWALPGKLLLMKVLNDGLGWQREATRAVRLVSRSWKEVHDSSCVTVQVPRDVTDERLQLVCTRFPALTCLNLSCRANVTDVGTFMR